MVSLPRTCKHCEAKLMHYGTCSCPQSTLDWVSAERSAIRERLGRLDQIEQEAARRMTFQEVHGIKAG